MKAFVAVLDEVRYPGLAAIALGASVAISGVSALLVGGLWITWRLWESLGLPVAALFKGVIHVGYWPAPLLLSDPAARNQLAIAASAFAGWFAVLLVLLFVGRKLRQFQGRALP